MPPASHETLRLRVLHDGAQPGPAIAGAGPVVTLDAKGRTHSGTPSPDGRFVFDFTVQARLEHDRATFTGPFCQGSPADRFLYLAWPNPRGATTPWAWRIKLPLAQIGPALIEAAVARSRPIEADATGRKPHSSEAVAWRLG